MSDSRIEAYWDVFIPILRKKLKFLGYSPRYEKKRGMRILCKNASAFSCIVSMWGDDKLCFEVRGGSFYLMKIPILDLSNPECDVEAMVNKIMEALDILKEADNKLRKMFNYTQCRILIGN